MSGLFISFEGPDGAGKTTVLEAVTKTVGAQLGDQLLVTREPGGNQISEAIRDIILNPENTEMDPRTEALLYAAARRQHLTETILPALRQGKVVLCDRYVDSSVAYQGAGRQIGEQAVYDMNTFATNGLLPDLTLYFDVPSEVGIARIKAHRQDDVDRLDQEALAFHKLVRAGYLRLRDAYPERITTVDATQPLNTVIQTATDLVNQAIANR
ncbi:dTMP kinase [Secundilactobacillus paracollinoides]|uniref:Thymidylate kinase n=1 Tax=Secundilactobacillus paracollinoides TaxID=240427 RepID=A0A1B2IZI9_9LACO|nr:dTMP kinase [Secundilactobacillus paracollinoides]ANZ61552.1 dTMP kinase [Secundilactobacillus paracollinoides]ANZ64060.1 dTMP kinase [Secundilactobacillus paracollinoides]ANZ67473.1 dTMP kinase [Secundilactobacillus paracollinoides]KRL76896.1 thymidylate kinase [Secundilactobacillus paracollinoides DSM 15502 = JCM 11969]